MVRSESHNAVRAAFVGSLFERPGKLVPGVVLQAAAVFTVYVDVKADLYLVLLAAVIGVGVARECWSAYFFRTNPDLSHPPSAEFWERSQFFLVTLGALVLGIFAFVAVHIHASTYSMVVAAMATLGAAISVVGKYFGSPRITYAVMTVLMGPFALGLMLNGQIHQTIMAMLYLPSIFLVGAMARNLRATLNASARGSYIIRQIADRFDTALKHMPQGLLMVSADGRIEVANRSISLLLNLPKQTALEGRSLDVVFRLAKRRNLFRTNADFENTLGKMNEMMGGKDLDGIKIKLVDDRTLQVTGGLRPNGGAVFVVEDISERMRQDARIKRMARYDELTGLSNRAYFNERASKLLTASSSPMRQTALFVIDVNGFKSVNDSHGHHAGDELLKAVADEIEEMQGRNVLGARLGGDEFAILLLDAERTADVDDFANEIERRLACNLTLDGIRHQVSVSVGYTLRTNHADLESMLMQADLALNACKSSPSLTRRCYDAELDRALRERMVLRSALGAAIRGGELTVVFQPLISTAKQKLEACEALVRWTHPHMGPISPAVFVPIAEQMGLVPELTRQVLEKACAECANWPKDVSVSVNLSALDFENDLLVLDIVDILKRFDLDPGRLELEITETAAMHDMVRVQRTLSRLREIGCTISLDDFGVGYSGLSQLHALPLDRIKIDRSFTLSLGEDEQKSILLGGILDLSKRLGLSVTVEGIEDYVTLEKVLATGPVNRIQGFVFGGHFNATQIAELVSRHYAMKAPEPSVAKPPRSRPKLHIV